MSDYDWDIRFIKLAKFISTWSKDTSTKVGAVIVRPDRTIASIGYNGFPKAMKVGESRTSREEKLARIIHAEINAILNSRESLEGCTLYTYPYAPCERCAVQVIQAGIKRVVALETPEDKIERWGASIDKATSFFEECGVIIDFYEEYIL